MQHRVLTRSAPLLLMALVACNDGGLQRESSRDPDLFVTPDSEALRANPELAGELSESAHDYFRFINVPFAQAVCDRFEADLAGMPTVTLHGDAHVEQYAVTGAGRGLTDFDDTASGPAVVDLVRFGVSLELAVRARGWESSSAAVFDAFLEGYRAGLEDPEAQLDEPAVAQRLRSGFGADRLAFLSWADSLMKPLSEGQRSDLVTALADYAPSLQGGAAIPPEFLEIQAVGATSLGIGSALDEKYLLRVEGRGEGMEDDVVLEAKEIRDLSGVSCMLSGPKADPFRLLTGPASEAYEPYLGFFELHGKPFWIHAWIGSYEELSIEGDFQSPDELAAVARESGLQLAVAHLGNARDGALARRQLQVLAAHEDAITAAVADLTQLSLESWRRFRRATTS